MKEASPTPNPSPNGQKSAHLERGTKKLKSLLAVVNLLSLAGLDRTFGVDPRGRVKHGPEDPVARKKRKMAAKSRLIGKQQRAFKRRRNKNHNKGQRKHG